MTQIASVALCELSFLLGTETIIWGWVLLVPHSQDKGALAGGQRGRD